MLLPLCPPAFLKAWLVLKWILCCNILPHQQTKHTLFWYTFRVNGFQVERQWNLLSWDSHLERRWMIHMEHIVLRPISLSSEMFQGQGVTGILWRLTDLCNICFSARMEIANSTLP